MSMIEMSAARPEGGLARADALLNLLFTTAKELRHEAERILGELFVPTEVVDTGESSGHFVLRPAGLGEIHLHAERERRWHPYRVVRVDQVVR